jgi:hypothetical protein
MRTVILLAVCVASGWTADTPPPAPGVPVLSARIELAPPANRLVGETPEGVAQPPDPRVLSVEIPVCEANRLLVCRYTLRSYAQHQIIPPASRLEYDVRNDPTSTIVRGAIDLEARPRLLFTFRDQPGMRDQEGRHPHPAADLGRRTVGAWYHRQFDLSSVAGKPFDDVYASFEVNPTAPGTIRADFRNVRIVDAAGAVRWNLLPDAVANPAEFSNSCPPGSRLSLDGAAGASLVPERFWTRPEAPPSWLLMVRNFDGGKPLELEVAPRLSGASGTVFPAQRVTLAPGEVRQIRLAAPDPLPPGQYTPEVSIHSASGEGVSTGEPLTVTDQDNNLLAPGAFAHSPHFALGADLEFPPLDALAHIRGKGANYANLFVSWADVETSPGRYDFSRLDALVRDTAQAGLAAEIYFITRDTGYPVWYRSECMVDQTGSTWSSGTALSYWAPTARPAYLRLVTAVVEHFRGNPTIVSWSFTYGGWLDAFYYRPSKNDGRLALYDYSAWSQAAFRGFVRDVLGLDLAEAAQRYGIPLHSWDELKQPEPRSDGIDVRPIWWDFQCYRCWSVASMLSEVSTAVRAVDPVRPIEYNFGGAAGAIGRIGNDYEAGATAARIFNGGIHNTCYEDGGQSAYLGTLSRRLGIPHTCETAGTPATLERHQAAMFGILRSQASGYAWISGANPRGIYPSYSAIRPVAETLSSARLHPGPRPLVMWSLSATQCDLLGEWTRPFAWEPERFCEQIGCTPDILSDRSFAPLPGQVPLAALTDLDPQRFPMLIDSGLPVLTAGAADAIAAYVRRGGQALVTANSGGLTPGDPTERHRLLQALGGGTPVPVGTGERITALGRGPLAGVRFTLHSLNTLAPLPAGSEILAQAADGRPMLVRWRLGQGSVLLLAGSPLHGDAGMKQAVQFCLAQAGIRAPVEVDDGIESAVLNSASSTYVLLSNPSRTPRTVQVRLADPPQQAVRVSDLMSRSSVGDMAPGQWDTGCSVHLEPWAVTALALDPLTEPVRRFPPLSWTAAADSVAARSEPTWAPRPCSRWLVVGPFANPDGWNGASFWKSRGPEADWSATARYHDGDQERTWQPVTAPDGKLDIESLMPLSPTQVIYAQFGLSSPTSQRVQLRMGADYGALLFLDGEPAFASQAQSRGAAEADEWLFNLELHSGINRVSVKLAPGSRSWCLWSTLLAAPEVTLIDPAAGE